MTGRSVHDKALDLLARARAHADGENERRQRQQVGGLLEQVEPAVRALVNRVTAVRAAARLAVPVPDLGDDIASGLSALESHIQRGLPSPQALRHARDRLRANASNIDTALAAVWRPWAEAHFNALELARAALLPPADRTRVDNLTRRLRQLAATPTPSAEEIGQFDREVRELRDLLDRVSPRDERLHLLSRLSCERVTLADLSDDELRLLRSERELAAQILLRRA